MKFTLFNIACLVCMVSSCDRVAPDAGKANHDVPPKSAGVDTAQSREQSGDRDTAMTGPDAEWRPGIRVRGGMGWGDYENGKGGFMAVYSRNELGVVDYILVEHSANGHRRYTFDIMNNREVPGSKPMAGIILGGWKDRTISLNDSYKWHFIDSDGAWTSGKLKGDLKSLEFVSDNIGHPLKGYVDHLKSNFGEADDIPVVQDLRAMREAEWR